MIIPRRPIENWIRLIVIDESDRVLLVREDVTEEHPESAPAWNLPGTRHDPQTAAEDAAEGLLARLALPAAKPQRLRKRTVSAIVAGEVARKEEILFVVRPDESGSPSEEVCWYPLPEIRSPADRPLPSDVADLLSDILTAPLPQEPVPGGP
ncbi:hypothetical protein ACIQPR_48280 [Streptomyces sp. NPDC091280]|uniref:hypothetical protein n=1 Tax=Streptomyces sp. NPDC091280 TaxID=3365984 RepID=UPI00381B4ACA